MNNQMPDYHVGQIWKDHKRDPESMFVITHVYIREYQNGERAQRVVGMITSTEPYSENTHEVLPHGAPTPGVPGDHLRDLDARSMDRMFPYQVWQSYRAQNPDIK